MILVAPKGSGTSVRANFLDGSGINSSFAVQQDYTGRARERTLALGIAIGSGYLFPTTFEHEVYSDLTGERGVLMGALAGIMEAQYNVLRKHGHTPIRGLQRDGRGADPEPDPPGGARTAWTGCTPTARTTAQRGALDWRHEFREAALPVFERLYESVAVRRGDPHRAGSQQRPDYKEKLDAELNEMREFGNVAGRRGGALPAPGKLEEVLRSAVSCERSMNWKEALWTTITYAFSTPPCATASSRRAQP